MPLSLIDEAACRLADAILKDDPSAAESSTEVTDARDALLSEIFDSGARPEYVKCVARNSDAKRSVCGRFLVVQEFSFLDWEHADGNEAAGRLVTCPTCQAIRAALAEPR